MKMKNVPADELPPGRFHEIGLDLSVILMSVTPSPVIPLVAVIQHRNINIWTAAPFDVVPLSAVFIVVPYNPCASDGIVESPVVGMRMPPRPVLRLDIATPN